MIPFQSVGEDSHQASSQNRSLYSFIAVLVSIFIIVGCLVFSLLYIKQLKNKPSSDVQLSLTQSDIQTEDILALNKNGVVRIVQHTTGYIMPKKFRMDLKNLSIEQQDGYFDMIPLDEYFIGTGFIVREDGYILTTADQVSATAALLAAADTLMREIVNDAFREIQYLDSQEFSLSLYARLDPLERDKRLRKLVEESIDYFLSTDRFYTHKEIVVLDNTNNDGQSSDLPSLIKSGKKATIISNNDDYKRNGNGFALIKINEENLPSLKFGDSDAVFVGQKLFVLGFPNIMEMIASNTKEPTFLESTVTAIRDSEKGGFPVFQIDQRNNFASGDGGSPIINDQGEVVGILSGKIIDGTRTWEEMLPLAIPIKTVERLLGKFALPLVDFPQPINRSSYHDAYMRGIGFEKTLRCERAIANFLIAKNISDSKQITRHIENCRKIQAEGGAIDTLYDEKMERLKKLLL